MATHLIAEQSIASLGLVTTLLAAIPFIIHRAFLHPLSSIPGPFICRFTSLWIWYHTYIGDDCTIIDGLHKKYGTVVRIGPNDCVISDGAALSAIYTDKGGFAKAPCYANFDFEGHSTIFSTCDREHRARRSKAVLPVFSMNNIRKQEDTIEKCAEDFVKRVQSEAKSGRSVNMLNLCRRLALDTLCAYVFQEPFRSIDEPGEKLSVGSFVDSAVALGRFFFLPTWMCLSFESIRARYFPSKDEIDSFAVVDKYSQALSKRSYKVKGSYQARLKDVGISDHEIEVQCKDLIFAGTDSSGTVLANICWWLCKEPASYAKLRDEVEEADGKQSSESYNPQSLKYLDAVVKEGLRLSRAQPTRFPRVVPEGGWTFVASDGKPYHFPAETVVGLQPLTLHFNPQVFPEPGKFNPDRWTEDCTPEMLRDLIPFNVGARQCIARSLATYDLCVAVRAIARYDVLRGAEAVGDEIKILEWFNARVVSGRIDIIWH